uniref:Putative structural protein n=1 Tax=viral metagenome TaxID=1070528 RepID=A0A6M3JBY9_9ZZZZ
MVLENWFPTKSSIRARGGSQKYATISTGPVLRMWTYKSGSAEQFLASDETNIFNITTVADPDVAPTAEVTGQTAGYYSVAQIGTAGGDYQYIVNGADEALLYDGTTFTPINGVSTPAITGVTTSTFSHVSLYASRLYFVEKNTMSIWYLPVDSIGGAAAEFSLAGIFQEGGAVIFCGKWSLDSGDGLDDKFVVVSNQGEVAVYQGLYPGDAAWTKVGVYKIAPSMGINAVMTAGGDFLMATEDGIVPISEAVNKDAAALSLASITRNIEPDWRKEVALRSAMPWEIMKWPTKNMAVVSLPVVDEGVSAKCYVVNLETGSWTFYTGWETRSLCHYENGGDYGNNTGVIYQMETGASDDGSPYTCTYVGLPDHIKSVGQFKVFHSARGTFQSNIAFRPKVSGSTNYKVSLPSAPSAAADTTASLWDVGLWDVATWDAGSVQQVSTKWFSVGRSGYAFMPQLQLTLGNSILPQIELISIDLIYENGGVMV